MTAPLTDPRIALLLAAGNAMAELLEECADEAVRASGDLMDGAEFRARIAAWTESAADLVWGPDHPDL